MWYIVTAQEAIKNKWLGDLKDVYKQSPDEIKKRYKAIGKFCRKIGINSVGGPAFSGAMLAHGVGVTCDLFSFNISGFRKRHPKMVDGVVKWPLLLVDDMIESGYTMEHALVSLYDQINRCSLSWEAIYGVLVFDYRPHEIKKISESIRFPLLRHLLGRERVFVLTEKRNVSR
jgi:hypothetical protein